MNERSDFWSRRKAQVKAQDDAEVELLAEEALAAEHAVLEEQSDEELLVHLNLPNPDDLQAGDDFSGFMAKAVPERLRRRALRKLWLSNPLLANVDGLIDYGEDFTDAATVIENMQTAYQVGKGMTEHVLEMLRQEEAEAALEAETALLDDLEAANQPVHSTQVEEQGDPTVATQEDLAPDPALEDTDNEYVSPDMEYDADEMVGSARPRRMRFEFEQREISVT